MDEHGEDEVGYCTNLMILPRNGQMLDFDRVRERLLALGTSGVVIGDEEIVKIHIHTEDPGAILTEAVRWGELDQIRIDNMVMQVDAVSEGVQAETGRGAQPAASGTDVAAGPQVVAVASGPGLVEVLRGLGATGIVSGGQTMNPSTEELLRAVEAVPGDEVILLPNNGNVILTAQQVVDLTSKRVAVVPTRSVPQGIAALSALNFDSDLDENVAEMTAAIRRHPLGRGHARGALGDDRRRQRDRWAGDRAGGRQALSARASRSRRSCASCWHGPMPPAPN